MGSGELPGDVRDKVAAALQAFSTARSVFPNLRDALDAGRAPGTDDLLELAKAGSTFAKAASALGLDPGRATLADLQAELAARESSAGLRRSLVRLSGAAGPAVTAPELASLAAEAGRLAGAPSWSPVDEAKAVVLARLVELADLAVQESDDDAIFSLDAELRESLGPEASGVVLAATRGRLVLPATPVEASRRFGLP